MKPVTLSAVIITGNEERNIGRCIDSLLPVVDEFVILDSFSTDGTVAVIHEKGLKCHRRQWEGYSDSKNYANNIARSEYILSIDADEALSPELQQSILAFKQRPADACELNRLTNYCGKWIRYSGWYPEYKLRIFRKGSAVWTGDVHEKLVFNETVDVVRLKGDLLHYSYPTVESHLRKIPGYASLAVKQDLEKGKRYYFLTHAVMKPGFMFIKKYFLKLGFMDGVYGFIIAGISAFERFIRYVKYLELTKK